MNDLLADHSCMAWYSAAVALIILDVQDKDNIVIINVMLYDGELHAIRATTDQHPSVGHTITSTHLPVPSHMVEHIPALFLKCNVDDLLHMAMTGIQIPANRFGMRLATFPPWDVRSEQTGQYTKYVREVNEALSVLSVNKIFN